MHPSHTFPSRTQGFRAAALAILLLFTLALVPRPAFAQEAEGMGTRFFQCREDAAERYELCMDDADGLIAKAKCYIAWDFDNIGCDLDLLENFTDILRIAN